ncbi:ferritin [Zunongwangia sp.]|uniref:ferritin n=1 Tax=Zunongwangia sp. TaxID=1965325 RepID=UPI003AA9DFC8
MKDIVRQNLLIHVDIMDLLNEQIKKESHSSATYLAMASWCDHNGLVNSAEFFYEQSLEEREHMMKIFHFINDNGGTAYSPEVGNINHDYGSLEEIFRASLDQEIAITKSIHNIVYECRNKRDLTTENFLQWYVNEQMEEEQTIRRILELFDLINVENVGLLFLDERIKDIRSNTNPE